MSLKIRKIEISHRTIIFAVLFVLFLRFLKVVQPVIIAVFIAYLISTAVRPIVKFLQRFRIPLAVSAFFVLFALLVGVLGSFASLLPLIIAQTSSFFKNLPNLIEQLGVYNIDSSVVTSQLSSLSSGVVQFAFDTFSLALFLLTIFVISFYLILERDHLEEHLDLLFGASAEKAKKLVFEVETKLGAWVTGEIFLMISIGLLTFVGLSLIGIDYVVPLAIIAGLLELVPNIGPTVAAVPAAIVGFTTSPLHGLLTVILAIIIQQLENSLIVPAIMRKAIGLPPIVTIIALMIGFQTGGALFAVLALPFVLAIQVILRYLYFTKTGEVKLVNPPAQTKDK